MADGPEEKGEQEEQGELAPSSAAERREAVREEKEEKKEIRELGWVLSVAIVLLSTFAVEPLFEKTALGSKMWLLAYETSFGPIMGASQPDVFNKNLRVVDVSQLRDSKRSGAFDLDRLEEVIARIARHQPRAIGIDLDMGNPNLIPDDPKKTPFMEAMLRIRAGHYTAAEWPVKIPDPIPKPIPIFIASSASRATNLLDDVATHDVMAALPYRPGDEPGGLKLAFWLKSPPYSLAQAVAMAGYNLNRKNHCTSDFLECAGAEDESTTPAEPEKGWETYFVNYAPIDWLQKPDPNSFPGGPSRSGQSGGLISIKNPSDIDAPTRESLAGTMVLVGDASKLYNDTVTVPLTGASAPGVYYQACSAYTFAIDPIASLKPFWRKALDFVFSGAGLSVLLFREKRVKDKESKESKKLTHWRLALTSFIVMILLGYLIAYGFHVVWLDFFVVAIFVSLHPTLERIMELGIHAWRKSHLEGSKA